MQPQIALAERGWLPDRVIRWGIRSLLAQRLRALPHDVEARHQHLHRLLAEMRAAPVALSTDVANAQHYEVPAAYFQACLGKHMKYSCCQWDPDVTDLDQAEARMLALTCQRAGVANGQRILELGCGWGSLSLWLATHYPDSEIVSVSNSQSQRAHIVAQAEAQGLHNLQVITADMNEFKAEAGAFDRVISVEMFEHMRNWGELLHRVASWLRPGGAVFLHVFCHREQAYFFADAEASDWMARFFFRDGLMPAADLAAWFQEDLRLEQQWHVNGRHYQRTCEAWLQRQDRARAKILPVFAETYGSDAAARLWWQRWRIFYLACSELFGYRAGNEWFVTHLRFVRR